jgi:predicted dehydrogenase
MSNKLTTSRRDFLRGSLVAGAGAALASQLSVARTAHAAGSDEMKAVLIGCGGRGRGAAYNCIKADKGVKIIAVADAFERQSKDTARFMRNSEEFAGRIDLPDDRVFFGLDAYAKAIACDPDLVLIATPPGFRPQQYSAAIKAGKHVFMEKPVCVDAPGYNIVVEANKLADEKGLKVGVGLQRHHQQSYIETMKRIHDGALGDIQFLRAYWNGDGIWTRGREPGMTEMQYQVHNWYHFTWVSGDNICEQHVHNLDVCNWVMNDHPVEANGMGGCSRRYLGDKRGTGQIFDHHFVEFTYKNGTKMYSQCRHMQGTWGNVSEAAHGTKGESNCAGWIKAAEEWRFRGEGADPYDQEHVDLLAAIRKDEKYNEGWFGATSSFTAVLGRMATYSGQVVKWDDAVKQGKSKFPQELTWDAPAPEQKNADGDYAIAVPGVTSPYDA